MLRRPGGADFAPGAHVFPGGSVHAEDRLLGELDPPLHTAVRRVMVTSLTPTIVHQAEPFIRQTALELLGRIPVPGSVDLVAAFTVPLPNQVTVQFPRQRSSET